MSANQLLTPDLPIGTPFSPSNIWPSLKAIQLAVPVHPVNIKLARARKKPPVCNGVGDLCHRQRADGEALLFSDGGDPSSDNRCPQVGPGMDLFDYIATCLHTFMERHELEGVNLPLGFTFSFPLVQVRH